MKYTSPLASGTGGLIYRRSSTQQTTMLSFGLVKSARLSVDSTSSEREMALLSRILIFTCTLSF